MDSSKLIHIAPVRILHSFIIALLILSAGFVHGLYGQNPARDLLRYGELAYAEVHRVPSDKEGKARIEVLVRVSYDFMVFTRSGLYSQDSTFNAGLALTIDLSRKPDIYVASENRRTEVFASEYETTNTRNQFVLFKNTFYLDSGRYVIDVKINDEKSTRTKSFALKTDITGLFVNEDLVLGSIVPLRRKNKEYQVLGFGGSLLYTRPTIFAVTASGVEGAEWNLHIDRIVENNRIRQTSIPLVPVSIFRDYGPPANGGVVPEYTLERGRDVRGLWVIFTPPLDSLPVGDYRFTVVAQTESKSDSLVQNVEVFWKEMPLSLRDPTFAAELMRYVMTEDEHDELTSGSDQEIRGKLYSWWEKQDPTPSTPYNERMYEYFRRVDEAYYRFQTTKRVNGALTDRGKIFILYGEPESINRDLMSDQPPQEVWKYPSLDKTFRFIDRERNGSYRLAN